MTDESKATTGEAYSPPPCSTFMLKAKMGEEREEARALAEWISHKRSGAFLRALFEELQFMPSRNTANAGIERPQKPQEGRLT
jgi:hypothetical protein